jgi:hypothetical protein
MEFLLRDIHMEFVCYVACMLRFLFNWGKTYIHNQVCKL